MTKTTDTPAAIEIPVTIDASGNINNIPAVAGKGLVTWSVRGGTISSIIPTPKETWPFKETNLSSSNGQWSATLEKTGGYTVVDAQGKQKPALITYVAPVPVKN